MKNLNVISLPENILDNIKNEAHDIKVMLFNNDINSHNLNLSNLNISYDILLSQLKELKISFKKYYNINLGE